MSRRLTQNGFNSLDKIVEYKWQFGCDNVIIVGWKAKGKNKMPQDQYNINDSCQKFVAVSRKQLTQSTLLFVVTINCCSGCR